VGLRVAPVDRDNSGIGRCMCEAGVVERQARHEAKSTRRVKLALGKMPLTYFLGLMARTWFDEVPLVMQQQ